MAASASLPGLIEAVRKLLARQGALFNPPAAEAAIAAAEAKLGVCLPADLREVYRVFDGTQNESGEALWRFWPLTEMQVEDFGPWRFGASSGKSALHLPFCDALIWCPRYAVCVDPHRTQDTEVWMLMGDGRDDRNAYHACSDITRFLELFLVKFGDALIMEAVGENSGCHPPEI